MKTANPGLSRTMFARSWRSAIRQTRISDIDEEDVRVISIDTTWGCRGLNAVNEAGLYQLIFRSRKPAARRFLKWVTKEVLPQIHRTGRYQPTAPGQDGPTISRPTNLDSLTTSAAQPRAIVLATNALNTKLERYLHDLKAITSLINGLRGAAQAFDRGRRFRFAGTLPALSKAPCAVCCTRTRLDLAHLITGRARELDIMWRSCQDFENKLRKAAETTDNCLADYVENFPIDEKPADTQAKPAEPNGPDDDGSKAH